MSTFDSLQAFLMSGSHFAIWSVYLMFFVVDTFVFGQTFSPCLAKGGQFIDYLLVIFLKISLSLPFLQLLEVLLSKIVLVL